MKKFFLIALLYFPLSIFSALHEPLDQKALHLAQNTNNINPAVLKLALTAYQCALSTGKSKEPILTIVDYSKPSSEKRLWVLDLSKNKTLFHSLVAHGKGSGEVWPHYFSDEAKTHASSLGLFVTGNTYQGHNGYSLRLQGLEKNFNEKAASRAIVIHGANYVNATLAESGRIGRSWGCPAVPKPLAGPIINTIKGGSIVFAYYPNPTWLKQSSYLHCTSNT